MGLQVVEFDKPQLSHVCGRCDCEARYTKSVVTERATQPTGWVPPSTGCTCTCHFAYWQVNDRTMLEVIYGPAAVSQEAAAEV
jgi:hypothetical protein